MNRLSNHHDKRQIDQWWAWIQDYGELAKTTEQQVLKWAQRLEENYPVQYIFNRAPFFDLDLYVDENVLIPRPETEELVYETRKLIRIPNPRILDIGTGSGAIPLALKKLIPSATVYGCDIDDDALRVARRNSEELNLEVEFFEGDFMKEGDFSHLSPVDVIISNPPYIHSQELDQMTSNTQFEPDLALFAPDDDVPGVYEQLAVLAGNILKPDGILAMELNEHYGEVIHDRLQSMGWKMTVLKDMQGKDRILIAIRKGGTNI